MTVLEQNQAWTKAVLAGLQAAIERHLGTEAERILRDDTCIYVVGSGGRGEMAAHSDVDLFVTRVGRHASDDDSGVVKDAIERALSECGLPAPSQDGAFLKMHTAEAMCESMGTPRDDADNTLTARMLLVLESSCLLNPAAYERVLAGVLTAYRKNVVGHDSDYQPFVLVNDIVRYWRILLLNYVAKNNEKERELTGDAASADWRLRSYKLRFSRCLLCFSMLTSLLSATATGNVSEAHVLDIVRRTPIARLRAVGDAHESARPHVQRLLDLYETFLETTARPKEALRALMAERTYASARLAEGGEFGDQMFRLLLLLGETGRAWELLRYMVV